MAPLSDANKSLLIEMMQKKLKSYVVQGEVPRTFGFGSVCIEMDIDYRDMIEAMEADEDFRERVARAEENLKAVVGDRAISSGLDSGKASDSLEIATRLDPDKFGQKRQTGSVTLNLIANLGDKEREERFIEAKNVTSQVLDVSASRRAEAVRMIEEGRSEH